MCWSSIGHNNPKRGVQDLPLIHKDGNNFIYFSAIFYPAFPPVTELKMLCMVSFFPTGHLGDNMSNETPAISSKKHHVTFSGPLPFGHKGKILCTGKGAFAIIHGVFFLQSSYLTLQMSPWILLLMVTLLCKTLI